MLAQAACLTPALKCELQNLMLELQLPMEGNFLDLDYDKVTQCEDIRKDNVALSDPRIMQYVKRHRECLLWKNKA